MVVSALIPTRMRPENLTRSISSLLDLAAEPDDVEIMLGMDDDDPRRGDYKYPDKCVVRVGPRRGYQGLHHYYNDLAAHCRGDFIMLWNDDTEVLTQGWDALLRDGPLFSVQNPRRDVKPTTDYTFPVMGRPVYEAMGHFARNPYNDAYVSHVAFYSGVAVIRDDVAFHHHCLVDAAAAEHGSGGIERFHNAEEVAMRQEDMEKIMRAPGYASRFDGYDVEKVTYDFKLKYEYRVRGETLEAPLIGLGATAWKCRRKAA